MDRQSFATWIAELTSEGRLDVDDAVDLLRQRVEFERGAWKQQIAPPERDGEEMAVGLIAGEAYAAPTAEALLSRTDAEGRPAMMYFEVVTRQAWESDY